MARFEVHDSKDKQFYAIFRASNGQIVWWTETYRNKQDAINACYLIKNEAPGATVYDHTSSAGR
jgi:uncharacterized protein YegP (UPF0339 family)